VARTPGAPRCHPPRYRKVSRRLAGPNAVRRCRSRLSFGSGTRVGEVLGQFGDGSPAGQTGGLASCQSLDDRGPPDQPSGPSRRWKSSRRSGGWSARTRSIERDARLAEGRMEELIRVCHLVVAVDEVKSLATRLLRLHPLQRSTLSSSAPPCTGPRGIPRDGRSTRSTAGSRWPRSAKGLPSVPERVASLCPLVRLSWRAQGVSLCSHATNPPTRSTTPVNPSRSRMLAAMDDR
jgi:hypothetical protein